MRASMAGQARFAVQRHWQLCPTGMSARNHRHQVGLMYFAVGILAGFLLSTFIYFANFVHHSSPSTDALHGIPLSRTPSSSDNGWSQIHVFYGNTNHIADYSFISTEYFHNVEWFSQVRQDELVIGLLRGKRNGYFVDLAANDPVKISNTYALETRFGWRGLCIEPNPMYWAGLSYRRCDVVAAVVGASNMEEVEFKYPNRAGPTGGIVGREFDNKQPSKFGEDHRRYTVTLRDIFRRFDTPKVIDYLSLDVEGAEEFVMNIFPFDQYQFNILTLERPSDEMKTLLMRNGYKFLKLLKRNSGETLWIHESIERTIDREALNLRTDSYKFHDSTMDYYLNRDSPTPPNKPR